MPTILLTGANRGIGLEFARQYAADGWQVHAGVRNPDAAAKVKEIRGEVTVHRLDVTEPASIAALASTLASEPVDLLLNNAGVGDPWGELGKLEPEGWIGLFRVNSIGPALMAQAFLPHLEKGRRKLIVSITSRMGSSADNHTGGSYYYRTSKAALNMISRSLAVDFKPRGIASVVFHPGWVQTEMGGPNAPIGARDSVRNLRRLIDRLTPADSGKFFNYDGKELPW